MTALAVALLIGVIAGLRALTAPAAVAWAAYAGWLTLSGSWLNFLSHSMTPWVFTVLALGELVTDQLPSTPSRTVPVAFGTRIVSGGICGAAIGFDSGALWSGAIVGVIGAIIGTLGGRAARGTLAAYFGKDRPAAFIEDAVAIGGACLILMATR